MMNQSGTTSSRCAAVPPTPRPRTSYNSWKPVQNMPYKECCQTTTTTNIKPRINLTEYTDRYVHPDKHEINTFGSGMSQRLFLCDLKLHLKS